MPNKTARKQTTRQTRWCYFVTPSCDHVEGRGWRISVLVEGLLGHHPTGHVSNGPGRREPLYVVGTFSEAEREVFRMNRELGIDHDAYQELFASAFPGPWHGEPVGAGATKLLAVTSPEFPVWRPHVEVPADLTDEEVREVASMMAANDDMEWDGLADAPLRIKVVRDTKWDVYLFVRRTNTGGLTFLGDVPLDWLGKYRRMREGRLRGGRRQE